MYTLKSYYRSVSVVFVDFFWFYWVIQELVVLWHCLILVSLPLCQWLGLTEYFAPLKRSLSPSHPVWSSPHALLHLAPFYNPIFTLLTPALKVSHPNFIQLLPVWDHAKNQRASLIAVLTLGCRPGTSHSRKHLVQSYSGRNESDGSWQIHTNAPRIM